MYGSAGNSSKNLCLFITFLEIGEIYIRKYRNLSVAVIKT